MDQYAQVLLSFPPETLPSDNESYDKAAKIHLSQLSRILRETSADLIEFGPELIELLDPSVNSLSFLAVLHTLILPGLATNISHERLLEKLIHFMFSFDAIQIRYAGSHLQEVFAAVGSGQILPPHAAVKALSHAILRLDPTGSILTSSHLLLARLSYNSDQIDDALEVIDKSIVFYPGMANRGEAQYLCDPTLSSPSYISRETGLTAVLKPQNVMEYDLLCGMMYCSKRDWVKASAAFERVVTFPTREHGISKIMVDAYKRWVLVSLLWKGVHLENPSPLAATAIKFYEVLGKPYTVLASHFPTEAAHDLKNEADANAQLWQEDNTVGLVREVLAAYQKWRVLALQDVYSKISIAEVRRQTRSAETGTHLPRDEDAEALVRNMIISGMLSGVVEKNDDGTAFLAFLPANAAATAALSEQDFAAELARSAQRLRQLRPLLRATEDRLATHKDYIRHVVKESKRDKSSDFAASTAGFGVPGSGGPGSSTLGGLGGLGGGFNVEVDDEDLMGGIISTG